MPKLSARAWFVLEITFVLIVATALLIFGLCVKVPLKTLAWQTPLQGPAPVEMICANDPNARIPGWVRIGSQRGWLGPENSDCGALTTVTPATNTSLNLARWRRLDSVGPGKTLLVCADQAMPPDWTPILLSFADSTGCDYQRYGGAVPGFGNVSLYRSPPSLALLSLETPVPAR